MLMTKKNLLLTVENNIYVNQADIVTISVDITRTGTEFSRNNLFQKKKTNLTDEINKVETVHSYFIN